MIRLILVQHAQTSWNALGRYQGHTDIPLDEHGQRQASRLGPRFASEPIGMAYTSDLRRARETAAGIADHRNLTLRSDPRLRELCFGMWEGLTYAQIRTAHPVELAAWEADPEACGPPGGESLADMAARLRSFLDELRQRESEASEATLVVGHRGSLRLLMCLALGLPLRSLWRFRLDAASISELELHADLAVLKYLNDTHHLREASDAR
jgi:alpha-ribazole phosphatase